PDVTGDLRSGGAAGSETPPVRGGRAERRGRGPPPGAGGGGGGPFPRAGGPVATPKGFRRMTLDFGDCHLAKGGPTAPPPPPPPPPPPRRGGGGKKTRGFSLRVMWGGAVIGAPIPPQARGLPPPTPAPPGTQVVAESHTFVRNCGNFLP